MIDPVLLSQRVDGDVGGKVAGSGPGADGAFHTDNVGAYVGGQPVGLTASGLVFATLVTPTNYIGMFFNNALIDANVGANLVGTEVDLTTTLPTVLWKGPVKVRMFKGTRHNVDDVRPPFASGVTWALGDHMYLDPTQGGQWTNVSGAGDKSHGRVIIPPASVDDVLEAQMMDNSRI